MPRRRVFTPWRLGAVLLAVFVAVAGTVVTRMVFDRHVNSGGYFELEVAGESAPSAGRFIALTRHHRRAKNPKEVWAVLFSQHPHAAPRKYPGLRPLEHDTGRLSTTGSASDAAWIAARHLLGLTTEFRWEYVVSESTPESAAAQLGVQPGDEIRVNEGFIRVDDNGEPLLLSRSSSEIRLTRAFTLPNSRPSLKKPPRVTGESAGLADALVFLDHLSPGDLTAGLSVAATGVISLDGAVIPVGSVALKTEAAISAKADVLFMHPDNVSTARNVLRAEAGHVPTLVPVSHLHDAAEWLCTNGATTAELCNKLQS